MKHDLEAITKAARTEVKCTIPGSVLMYLANTIKEKHIQMQKILSIGEAANADTQGIEREMEANENVGAFLLGLIHDEFGEEFLDMFLGLSDSDDAKSKTIN